MHRLVAFVVALVITLSLVPVAAAAEPAVFLTIGPMPVMTREESITVRGTATRGKTLGFYVNGELRERVIAGPGQDTYYRSVPLDPGENRIVAVVEGTEVQAERTIVRVTQSFDDLKGHKLKDDCEMLYALGIVNGVGDGKFGPDLPLTRAQFAKMVVLGLKLQPETEPALDFADKDTIPVWAQGFVATAVAKGLITGFDDGTFRPNEPVVRSHVVVIAARGLRHKGVKADGKKDKKKFKDDHKIPGWARADVDFTASAGVIGDFWGDDFDSDRPATRALAAAVVRRLYTAK